MLIQIDGEINMYIEWFKSYISDRYQFVAVKEEMSYRSQVKYSVMVYHKAQY